MATFLEMGQNIAVRARLPEPSTIYGSNDKNSKLIKRCLIEGALRDVFRAFDWSVLVKKHSFSTENGTAYYSLPTDFDRIINGTIWNETSQRQVVGPLTIQDWALYQNDAYGVSTVDYVCRIIPVSGVNKFYLHEEPSGEDTISYYYIKNKYILSQGEYISEWSSDDDTTVLDDEVVEQAAMWRLLRDLGLDYAEEKIEFNRLRDERASHDGGAAPVSISSRYEPGVFVANVPITGLG